MKSLLSHLRRSPHSTDDVRAPEAQDSDKQAHSAPAQRRSVSYGNSTATRRALGSPDTPADDHQEILAVSSRRHASATLADEHDRGSVRSRSSFARDSLPLAQVFRRRSSGIDGEAVNVGRPNGPDEADAAPATVGRRARLAALGVWRHAKKDKGNESGLGNRTDGQTPGDKPLPVTPKRPTLDPSSPRHTRLANDIGAMHLRETRATNGGPDGSPLSVPKRIESPLPSLPREEFVPGVTDEKLEAPGDAAVDADATLRDRRRSYPARKPLPHLATSTSGSRNSGFALSLWSEAADFAALISAADPATSATASISSHSTTSETHGEIGDVDSVTIEGDVLQGEHDKRKVAFKSPDVTPAASVKFEPPNDPSVAAKRSFFRRRTSQPPLEVAIQEDVADAQHPLPSPSKRLRRSGSGSSAHPAERPPAKIRGFKRPSSPSALNARHTPASAASATTPSFTPTSADMARTHSDRIAVRQSWAEMTEDDLVANLSPRERTRQEALWEIVGSEDRYIADLIKLKTTFADALLPDQSESGSPYLLPDPLSPALTNRSDSMASMRSAQHHARMTSPSYTSFASESDDGERLPIAARYASPKPGEEPSSRARGDSTDSAIVGLGFAIPAEISSNVPAFGHVVNGRPSWQGARVKTGRGHHSLPPPPRQAVSPIVPNSRSVLNTRYSVYEGRKVSDDSTRAQRLPSTAVLAAQTSMARKLHKRDPSLDASAAGPIQLPESLTRVFKAISDILDGHMALWRDLNARYEEQYPLVRTFCDVFIAHSYIFTKYQDYILNLEDALNQVDDILHQPKAPKRASLDLHDPQAASRRRLAETLDALDQLAADQGESGLFISLSKPFHRLLRYPLMFQNLLFHTDPTMKEYDATIEIIAQVEKIVRHMEDEKWSQEQRAKTRDALSRIEGLERDRQLAAPQASRVFVEEMPYARPTQDGKSHKRLSDLLHKSNPESKMDLWIVRFSDVEMLCNKVGTTSLPMGVRGPSSRQAKSSTVGRRSTQILPRNLYHLIRVLEWKVAELPPVDDREPIVEQDAESLCDSDDSSVDLPPPPPPPVPDEPLRRPVRASMPPSTKQVSTKADLPVTKTVAARPGRNVRSSLPAPPLRTTSSTARKISSGVASSDAKFGHRLRSSEEGVRTTPRALPKTSTLTASTASQRAKAVTKSGSTPPARATPPLRPKTNVPASAPQHKATGPTAGAAAAPKRQYAPKAPGKRI